MSPSQRGRLREVAPWGGAVVVIGAAVMLLWPSAARPRATPPVAVTSAKLEPKADPLSWQPGEARQAAIEAPLGLPETVLIDEVRVDRTDVCPHEPVLVEVKAHDPRAKPRRVRVQIGTAVGNPAPVSFVRAGDHRLAVQAVAEDGPEDARLLTIHVHDCGGAFQYVAVAAESAARLDTLRFTAHPFFDRAGCADPDETDAGEAARTPESERRRVLQCNAQTATGETIAYRWDFGDGTTETTNDGYVEHDYSSRPEDDLESSFVVRVEVESSVLGKLTGFTSVVLSNASYANKARLGVITPYLWITSRVRSEGHSLVWDATARNPDSATLTLEDVDVVLTPCDGGGNKTFSRAARDLLDTAVLPPGTTTTKVHLSASDTGQAFCAASFTARGFAPGGYKVESLFGAQLRDDIGAMEIGPDSTDPVMKKRYERNLRALQLLGRGQDGSPATVTDDEIRALQLQGKLD